MPVKSCGELSARCRDTDCSPGSSGEGWAGWGESSLPPLYPPLPWPWDAADLRYPARCSEMAVGNSLYLTLLPELRNSTSCKSCQREGTFLTCFESQCGPRNGWLR